MDHLWIVALLFVTLREVNGQYIGDALYRCMACTGVLQQEFSCTVNCDRAGRPFKTFDTFVYSEERDFLSALNFPSNCHCQGGSARQIA